jgi:hypothetical protein
MQQADRPHLAWPPTAEFPSFDTRRHLQREHHVHMCVPRKKVKHLPICSQGAWNCGLGKLQRARRLVAAGLPRMSPTSARVPPDMVERISAMTTPHSLHDRVFAIWCHCVYGVRYQASLSRRDRVWPSRRRRAGKALRAKG